MLGCKELRSLKTDLQQRLIREVLQGAADVALNEQIEPERVVQLVVLEIQRDDGCLFVQIGKTDNLGGVNQIIPSCALPGGRHAFSMQHEDVCEQLLCTKLRPLKGCIGFHQVEVSPCVMSNSVPILTRYNKTVYHGKLHRHIEAPICRYSGQVQSWRERLAGNAGLCIPIAEVDVYVMIWNGKTYLYAWLSKKHFDHLMHSKDATQFLAQWFSCLEPDPSSCSMVDDASSGRSATSLV